MLIYMLYAYILIRTLLPKRMHACLNAYKLGDTYAYMCKHTQSLVDIRSAYPNLGDTHFSPLFEALEKLEKKGVP